MSYTTFFVKNMSLFVAVHQTGDNFEWNEINFGRVDKEFRFYKKKYTF